MEKHTTNTTNTTNNTGGFLLAHGGYKKLASYQTATIIYDLTVEFCNRYMSYGTNMSNKSYRTYDQMVQAARSGKQNIAEGSQAAGTSRKTELKLLGVARASLAELLADYAVRGKAYETNRTYTTYMTNGEAAANCLICLINQACYLLDRQRRSLEAQFSQSGGYSEQLLQSRLKNRRMGPR